MYGIKINCYIWEILAFSENLDRKLAKLATNGRI